MSEKKQTPLNSVKSDFKKIDQFVKGRPIPSAFKLDIFIKENDLEHYRMYAASMLQAIGEREWIMYQNKANKYRV